MTTNQYSRVGKLIDAKEFLKINSEKIIFKKQNSKLFSKSLSTATASA